MCTGLYTFLFFLSYLFVVPLDKEAEKPEENIPLKEKTDENQNPEPSTTEVASKSAPTEEDSKLIANTWDQYMVLVSGSTQI